MPTAKSERLLFSPASGSRLGHALISAPDERISRHRSTRWVAILTGVTFVVAGLVKFVFHHWELHAFRSFGLPWPSALEIFAGVLEMVGGLLLALRRAVVPAAVLLGITMVVAIISSGIGHGDVIPSLTLAPLLLLATLFLLFRGLGRPGTR
jgi:putative oxidoreductase